jgi:hypothetical protein
MRWSGRAEAVAEGVKDEGGQFVVSPKGASIAAPSTSWTAVR